MLSLWFHLFIIPTPPLHPRACQRQPLLNDAQRAKINIFRAHEVREWDEEVVVVIDKCYASFPPMVCILSPLTQQLGCLFHFISKKKISSPPPTTKQVLEGMRGIIPDDQIPREYGGSCKVPLGHDEMEQGLRRQVGSGLVDSWLTVGWL